MFQLSAFDNTTDIVAATLSRLSIRFPPFLKRRRLAKSRRLLAAGGESLDRWQDETKGHTRSHVLHLSQRRVRRPSRRLTQ